MKAYRQVNFKLEKRLVWSYSTVLLAVGLLIMFRPVLAQEDDASMPELKIDIKKEYDESGNLVGVDSIRTWKWSGKNLSSKEFDSLWRDLNLNMLDFLPRNFDFSEHSSMHSFPPLHNFWYWNGEDSTACSYFDDLLNEDLLGRLNDHPSLRGFDDEWIHVNPDSLLNNFHGTDRFNYRIDQGINDFQNRFEGYWKEHQQLIEKYFREPV